MVSGSDIHTIFDNKSLTEIGINSQMLTDLLKENYGHIIKAIDSEYAEAFWEFIEAGESTSKEEYFEIKKRYFKNVGLEEGWIKTANLEDIAREIKYKLLDKIFFDFTIGESPVIMIEYLLNYILNEKTVKKHYNATFDHEYIGSFKEKTKIFGKIEITRRNERTIGTQDSDEEIDYNYISNFERERLYSMTYTHEEIKHLISDEIKYSYDDSANEIDFRFLFDRHSDQIDEYGLEDMVADIRVSFFQIKETWEKYLYESYRLYKEEKYQTSFLVAFSAMDSFIEFLIYCFKKYIEGLDINPRIEVDSVEILYRIISDEEFVKSSLKGYDDYYWYQQYLQLLNPSRRLIDEKLKQILNIIIYNNFSSDVEEIGNYFIKDTVFSRLKNSLSELVEIRNKLAHGNDVIIKMPNGEDLNLEQEPEYYLVLYAKLMVAFGHIISLLEGEDGFNDKVYRFGLIEGD